MQARELIELPVTLTIEGPILTAGSTFSGWGLDAVFYRDWRQKFALPGSLVRGKLREAMETLQSIEPAAFPNVAYWFGAESGNNKNPTESYAPRRGFLKLSDFKYKEKTADGEDEGRVRTRIRIDWDRLVVAPGALLAIESPFCSGGHYEWKGLVEFFSAATNHEACLKQLKQAFHLITAIGADKTIGCGKLINVAFGEPQIRKLPLRKDKPDTKVPNRLDIVLQPQEPMLIGGIRRKDNIFESEKIIPGAALKGALAVGLNRLAGNTDLSLPISDLNSPVAVLFPHLAKHFDEFRFFHAMPSGDKSIRTEAIPLSLACYGGACEDVAFKANDDEIWARGSMPVSFRVDWKDVPTGLPNRYKMPDIQYYQVTRTAIDDDLLKADEGKLYSFRMIKPDKDIFWVSQLFFPDSVSTEEKQALYAELEQVLPMALRYVGKRQAAVSIASTPCFEAPLPLQTQKSSAFAVTLQSAAVMLDPDALAQYAQPVFDDRGLLHDLYAAYWRDHFKDFATLNRAFASQELQGGYLGMRYRRDTYRPFYLTSAGSTFVFKVTDGGVWPKLDTLCRKGLPLPAWAKATYAEPLWGNCPFIPQNGYGEIKVHLNNKGD